MKNSFVSILTFLLATLCFSQQEFHVSPDGKSSGDGSRENPWDLQTALSQKSSVVNGGDTIWLHGGIYTGRFVSTIGSTKENEYITVAPYNDKVILNGNIKSENQAVLEVKGQQVIYRDFEVTWIGKYSRNSKDLDFFSAMGVSHNSGINCQFINLIIHNIPGLGFGSWKSTGATLIENCIIYNNGFMAKNGKGRGEGVYVQNMSEEVRVIRNNVIFNNYYKGIEVWSAGRKAKFEYVKNIELINNVVFNSGSASGFPSDNLIVATNDRNAVNIARNIKILNNVFYHNTDFSKNQINGDAPSLTLGFYHKAPIESIEVKNNVIIGRNNALRLLHVKSMNFNNNIVYSGYVGILNPKNDNFQNWSLDSNTYFTKRQKAFRIDGKSDYSLEEWQNYYSKDDTSQWQKHSEFNLRPILDITGNAPNQNSFRVVLFDKQGDDVTVDFSEYDIEEGSAYKIYDVENRKEVAASGIVASDSKITFPMSLTEFEMPLHNTLATKTPSNFGVFIIEFEHPQQVGENASILERFFEWLGF